MRIMAIDYGDARTGVAISDATGLLAGFTTVIHSRKSEQVLDELEKRLGIGVGETTADGMFTLNATRCIGCCGLAPAMMVNDEVYGRLVPGDVPGIIEKYRARG